MKSRRQVHFVGLIHLKDWFKNHLVLYQKRFMVLGIGGNAKNKCSIEFQIFICLRSYQTRSEQNTWNLFIYFIFVKFTTNFLDFWRKRRFLEFIWFDTLRKTLFLDGKAPWLAAIHNQFPRVRNSENKKKWVFS